MEENKYIGGISVLKDDIETLIRDSERLKIITEYVKNTTYSDKQTLLVLLGCEPENK